MQSATTKAPKIEMVIQMACANMHAWSHDAAKDPFAAECPCCGGLAALQVDGPWPRAAEEGAGLSEDLLRLQTLWRTDLTTAEIDELADLLGMGAAETVSLVTDLGHAAATA